VERIYSSELGEYVGSRVRVAGWIHRVRRLSRVSFLILRDARGLAQIVLDESAVAGTIGGLHAESVVAVEGLVVANSQAPMGVEIRDPEVEVISAATAAPPIDLFRPILNSQLPTLLDHAALTLRHPRRRASWQIAAASLSGFRSALGAMGFVEIHTPKIVGTATEGGANVFTVDYFGRPAYLAQSPQFYKQIMVGVFERVFEAGPVFRAEPHDTTRHLNEYVSLDAEMGFIRDHTTVMDLLTFTIRGMIEAVRNQCGEALGLLDVAIPAVPRTIPAIHFADALAMVGDALDEDLSGEPDLSPAHERWLGEWAAREHGSEFLFVVGYPMVKRPFYTHPDPTRPRYSNSFDLLFRGLELVTGGQRLHRYDDYVEALAARGQEPGALDGYLEAFRYGMPPHGGFAIGLERWVAQVAGVANVREVTLFPRDLQRLAP
jgi:nondiscriminating aspartyl-tRNA synthetase